jgi:hypothetical protein
MRSRFLITAVLVAILSTAGGAARQAGPQKQDAEYTAKIKEYTADPRVITELVDHMPASVTVPSPLKFFGRIPGTPDELTYYADIVRYLQALDKASDRVALFPIGKSDEGREMVAVAVADEATIKQIDKFKQITAQLTDPRAISEAQARQLIATGKPIYYASGAIHSPETGSPEMLMELAFRLAVEDTPFIRSIRNNMIFVFTPASEVDGRDKQVDTFYYGKKTGKPKPPLIYWGQYVAHDNNRDAMGLALKLTQNMLGAFLDWHPTVFHDLHESVPYLYTSTGTGPYNVSLDPLVYDEWWILSKYEVSEMTKRGVPGVWTYGFYDGWVPNYMFFIANSHNAVGRFYEVQSYGPASSEVSLPVSSTSREWYRGNPPLPKIKWSARNNVNIQESALLLAMNYVARNKETFLENYYLKNKRAIDRGKTEAPHAWIIPAGQRRKVEAAELVNLLRRQGAEVHVASRVFTSPGVTVAPGDYVVRMDQPYRTIVDILMDTQYFAAANPRPYDDTGWSFPLLRHVTAHQVDDEKILAEPMTRLDHEARVTGTITGTGKVLVIDHTTDNTLITFRFKHKDVKMLAAEGAFEAGGCKFARGSFIVPDADRTALEPSIQSLGLTACASDTMPSVKTHDLDIPRIGFVHAWTRTQDEGWVRLAFDTFGVPYTYFGDQKLRAGDLRSKFDVIVFPHVGGSPQSQVNGLPMTGDPIPYKKSELTPNLGVQDSSDDIRGGMGLEGLANLTKFVEEGGTLIVEGSTTTIFPAYGLTSSVTVEEPSGLFVRGSVLKALVADHASPIAYGYDADALPVYFNQAPVLSAGPSMPAEIRSFLSGGSQIPGVGQNITPNAGPEQLARLDPEPDAPTRPDRPQADETAQFREVARAFGLSAETVQPRVILKFPSNPTDLLLSGVLVGGQSLANKAVTVDVPLGKGHIVMFANRPYWRWQTQGSFFLGFNAILNWNDLDAGRPEPPAKTTDQSGRE